MRAWLMLVGALAIHVVDEAFTGFLGFYNPLVLNIRSWLPWFPMPTFTYGVWLTGLIVLVSLLTLLAPVIRRGGVASRLASWIFSVIMFLNGLGHLAGSLVLGPMAAWCNVRPAATCREPATCPRVVGKAATGLRLVGRRTGAYFLDIALLFAVLGPAGWLTQWALGLTPSTGQQIWATLLVNFSLPTWMYFTGSDASAAGATVGKRWLGLRVSRHDNGRLGVMQALSRTALKLLPWELVHLAAFGLAQDTGQFSTAQGLWLIVANALAVAYFAAVVATRGRRSVHDFVVGTVVRAAD